MTSEQDGSAAPSGTTGELTVHKTHKQNGATQYTESEEDSHVVRVPEPFGEVEFGLKRTIQTRPYESVTVMVSARMPCSVDGREAVYDDTSQWVLGKFVTALQDVEGFVKRSERNRNQF